MRMIFYDNIFFNIDKIVHFYYEDNEIHILFDNSEELSIPKNPSEYNKFIDYLIDESQKIINIHTL